VINSPAPFAVPQEALDKCRCDQKKRKTEKKQRQPRTVCKAGTYTQTARGVKYHPTKEVPCGEAASLIKSVKKKVSTKLPNIFGVPNAFHPY